MAKNTYRSYVLVGKRGNELIEIDWTKVKAFSSLKSKKYKLEQIDFFTSHFIDKQELLQALIDCNLLTYEQLSNLQLWIYQAKQNSTTEIIDGKKRKVSAPIYADEHLEYGVAYKEMEKFLTDDLYTIYYLQSKLSDYEFIIKLYNKYVKYGKYSELNIDNAKARYNSCKDQIRYAYGAEKTRYENMSKAYYKQYRDLLEINGLLTSVLAYASAIKKGEIPSNEFQETARNNIREFYLRIKYNVIRCTDGLNDNRTLTFEVDKNNNRKVNYLAFHKLVMFISNYQEKEKKEQGLTKPKVKLKQQVDGQLSLFPLE